MSAALEQARQGFDGLRVATPVREAALRNLELWLTSPDLEAYRPQIEWLIDHQRWPLLLDSFYQVLPFGTGGRRGPVGPGPNRFNTLTLATSVAGHVAFLKDRLGADGLRVVIAYDTRCFNDLKGLYGKDVDDPLRGMRSEDFAMLAARVYTGAGVEVMLPPPGTPMATPELSFAIRRLGAHGGLNVSASHNPPDDNGGKFYDHRGGQEVPPLDQQMVDRVAGVTQVDTRGDDSLLEVIPADLDQAYVEHNVALSVGSERDATVVYTPLHGTGTRTVTRVLEAAGFEVRHVAAQSTPDGRFPAVPFGVANPEVPASMELGVSEAKAIGADLVLATDPDADRIGCCARDRSGGYRFLSGNEIGALVIDAVLAGRARAGRLPKTPLVMRTEVTSDLVSRVARHRGAQVIEDLLVGFKYVAAVLDRLEHDGRYRDLVASRDDFVGAVEESHGVLLTPDIRDKDAAGPALVLAEIAARAGAAGRTMLDVLDDIYRRVGYVANRLTSVVMKGAAGQEAIATIQARLREDPPARIGGRRVVRFVDHWDQSPGSRFGRIRSDTDRAARNVLVFRLEGEGRIIIRPSGTEPKNKSYVEVGSSPPAAAEDLSERKRAIDHEAAALEAAFVKHCLRLIDVELPEWGYRISGLVALEHKLDFVGPFLRELDDAAAAVAAGERSPAELEQWIDERLRDYGRDARLLMADAFAAYLEVAAADARTDAARQHILDIEGRAFGIEERPAVHR